MTQKPREGSVRVMLTQRVRDGHTHADSVTKTLFTLAHILSCAFLISSSAARYKLRAQTSERRA